MKLGLLADAHGNHEAFLVGLDVLARHGVEQVYFLGDAVGYLPGGAVVAELAERAVPAVKGNHEVMLLEGTVPAEREAIYRLDETRSLLSPAELDALASWPAQRDVAAPCWPLVMVHGSIDDPIHGYVYPDTPLRPLPEERATTVFMGATHRPFVRTAGPTTYVNVGSCGLPRDRGDLGSACLFDDVTGEATILRFDITAATAAALARCGPVSPSVIDVFARREDFVGVLV